MVKRTCEGCRAFDPFKNGDRDCCSLNYKVAVSMVINTFLGTIWKYKPLEQCPKPKTYDAYIALRNKLHQKREQ